MKKRFFALVAMAMLVIPGILQAISLDTPENFIPGKQIVTMDLQLTGKLKAKLEPLVQAFIDDKLGGEGSDEVKGKTLINKFLNGERFFVGVSPTENVFLSFPVTEDEWKIFTKDTGKQTYNSMDVYVDDDSYFAKIGGFVVLTMTEGGINGVIDLGSGSTTDSLVNNTDYQDFTSSYFSPRLAGVTLDWKTLMEYANPKLALAGGEELKPILDLLEIFKMAGGSLTETPDGYKFNFKITGDADKLKEKGISLNPTGNFKPSLLNKLPNAKPIFYAEGFNVKANYAQEKKIIKDLAAAGENPEVDVFALIKEEIGIDFESIYNVFDQEFAVALQYDQNSPVPYLTLMANVANTKADATKLMTDLSNAITKLLKDSGAPKGLIKKTVEGGFTKLSFDITKVPDYDGPSLPEIVVTFGVSDDGLLIVSNYPGIDQVSKRTGIAADAALAAHNLVGLGEITSVAYFNVRNLWGMVDSFAEWAQETDSGKYALPLDFYQNYYSVLEKIYGWKDLFIVSKDTETSALLDGTVIIDGATHRAYSQFLDSSKTSDQDGDGVSDYDELYIYSTPVDISDSNNDGVSDVEELKKGVNPSSGERLFEDVPENTYYTADTAFLYQRRAIAGYPDGTFQPGKLVNRAEFTAMVVKSFENKASSMFGLNMQLKSGYMEFDDVPYGEWFYDPISKAYSAGWVSGSYDDEDMVWKFRPGDYITRAEAIAILNKASAALTKSRPQAVCSASGFKDVPEDAWFCGAVANAAKQGVTKGKAPGFFKPYDQLTRAEAAVMITRTLEKDLARAGAGTISTEEMAAPIFDLLH